MLSIKIQINSHSVWKENGIHPQNLSLSVFNVNNASVPVYSYNNNNIDERTYKLTSEYDKSYPYKIIKLMGLSDGSFACKKRRYFQYEEEEICNHSHSY